MHIGLSPICVSSTATANIYNNDDGNDSNNDDNDIGIMIIVRIIKMITL